MKTKVPSERELARKHGVSIKYIIRQAEIGSTVEREHTTSHKDAYDIALQHLDEFPDYYKHLLAMEKKLKAEYKKKKSYKQIKESLNVVEDHIDVAMGRELDDEGAMILNQIDEIQMCCDRLKATIKGMDMQLPGWVQAKVTLAADYINTVSSYMESKNEETIYEEKEEKKYCRLCQKPETRDECLYGGKAWDRFSIPIPSVK